jgi:hypothetical protein
MPPTERLTGVYNAEGSVLGELRYLAGRATGRAHCALCDITHGALREKSAWRDARSELPLAFEAVHLDERSDAERAASEGRTPCVLIHTADGRIELLLGPDELDRCAGSPQALVAAIERALAQRTTR